MPRLSRTASAGPGRIDNSIGRQEQDLGPMADYPGYLLRRAQVAVYQQVYRLLEPYDLRPTQFGILMVIRHNPGVRQSELAATLGLQRANLVPLLTSMEARNLLERRMPADDRRARSLHLTRSSTRMLAQLEPAVTACEREAAVLIGAAALKGLKRFLSQLPPQDD